MADDAALVNELQTHWLRGDGAAINAVLKRMLRLDVLAKPGDEGRESAGDLFEERGWQALVSYRAQALAARLDTDLAEALRLKRPRREAESDPQSDATQLPETKKQLEVPTERKKQLEVPTGHRDAVQTWEVEGRSESSQPQQKLESATSATSSTLRQHSNADRELILTKDSVAGLPTRSADFEAVLSLPRYANVVTLQMNSPQSCRLKLNTDACRAFGKLPHLRRVAMPHTDPHHSTGWPVLARALHHVEDAWLSTTTYPTVLLAASEHMTALTRLRLDVNADTERGPVENDGSDLADLKPLPNLRHLFMRGGGFTEKQGQKWLGYGASGGLNDDALSNILEKAPGLHALDVSFNFFLTSASVAHIGRHGSLRTFRWQQPSNAVTAERLATGLRYAHTLLRLDLSFILPSPDGPRNWEVARAALPSLSIVCQRRKAAEELSKFVPHGWPRRECVW